MARPDDQTGLIGQLEQAVEAGLLLPRRLPEGKREDKHVGGTTQVDGGSPIDRGALAERSASAREAITRRADTADVSGIEPGSDAWKQLRVGIPTASRMADLMARTKSGYGASRANLMADLIAERLTGKPGESYLNAAMQWGIDHEAEARSAYEIHRGLTVERIAFVRHPTLDSGASPDGLVGEDGLVEIKCPQTAIHIERLLTGDIPEKYILQMQWQMECAGRSWCDFVSYDPRMPEHLRLFIRRVVRNEHKIRSMRGEVAKFLAELEEKLGALSEIN